MDKSAFSDGTTVYVIGQDELAAALHLDTPFNDIKFNPTPVGGKSGLMITTTAAVSGTKSTVDATTGTVTKAGVPISGVAPA